MEDISSERDEERKRGMQFTSERDIRKTRAERDFVWEKEEEKINLIREEFN